MKNLFKIGLAAFASLSLGVCLHAADGVKWLENFQAAKDQAKASNLPVLALFTGSDWCPGCMFLESRILSDKEVAAFINKTFVSFKADFPRNRKIQPGVAKQNESLSEKYDIEGYPTLLIVDKDGKMIAKSYNESGNPKDFINQLKEMLGEGSKRK